MGNQISKTVGAEDGAAVGCSAFLACGETLTNISHGGSAEIVGITADGVMLRHPSGVVRLNKWSSMMVWKRKAFRPQRYGQIAAVIEATRKQANDRISDPAKRRVD